MRRPKGTPLPLRARTGPEPTLLGLEHEFLVRDIRAHAPVDFRTLVRSLPVDGRRIDPTDPNALRCSWGGLITADGREAEIAVDPVACRPGFVDRIADRAETGRRALRDALAPHLELEGYSTHLSVATPTRLTARVASVYAARFAAPMMLLLDRRESPGLLVRSRPGRTELCGEYARGTALRGPAAFATGSVLATVESLRHPKARRHLPPPLDLRLVPAAQRTGWYIDRHAFGPDLYTAGRHATLSTRRGTTTAQAQLERAWTVARAALTTAGLATGDDLAVTDAMVAGQLPLPLESTSVDERTGPIDADPETVSPFGRAIAERHRPWGRLTAAAMSWDLVVFAAAGIAGLRTGFAVVPRADLAGFLDDLDAGRLDAAIAAYLAAPPNGSRLAAASDVERASLYDEVAADRLGPDEPRPGAPLGRLAAAVDRLQGGHGGGSREDKHNDDRRPERPREPEPTPERTPEPTAEPTPRAVRRLGRPAIAAGVAAVVVVAVAGVALAAKGSDDRPAASAPTTTTVGAPGRIAGATSAPAATPNPAAAPTPPTRPPTTTLAPQLRFSSLGASDDDAYVNGTCDNGATPGRVAIWVSAIGNPVARVYATTPPPGVTAYEMTWVGGDRYEVLFPSGAVDIGNVDLTAVADCSGATTRKSGPSLMVRGIGADIENAPVQPGTPVTLVSEIDERIDQCTTRNYVDVKVQWGTVNADGDYGPIFASETMTRGADGKYRVTLDSERYFEELMVVGTYQSTTARCDWGNG